MAAISIAGKVVCKEGDPAVTVREFGNGGKIAKFSVMDQEYFYSKDDEKKYQFYTVEVSGKQAEFILERIQRGDRLGVRGQLVQRDYQDKTYLDVKNSSVTFLEDRRDTGGGESLF